MENNRYREWRPDSTDGGRRKRSAAWLPHLDRRADGVLPARRRRRTAQLVPATRVRRGAELENQLNDDAGTRFQVDVRYQPRDGIYIAAAPVKQGKHGKYKIIITC